MLVGIKLGFPRFFVYRKRVPCYDRADIPGVRDMLKKLLGFIPLLFFACGFILMALDLPLRWLIDRLRGATPEDRRRTEMDWQFSWSRFHAWYLFKWMGIRMPIHVEEQFQLGQPCIIIANHRTVLDPLIMAQVIGMLRLRSVLWGIKREMGDALVIGGSFIRSGYALLSRENREDDRNRLLEMSQLAKKMRASVALFAEGTRFNGIEQEGAKYRHLREPKRGGLQVLMNAHPGYPIIFVCIDWRGLRGGKTIYDGAGLLGIRGQVTIWQHQSTMGEDAQSVLNAGWARMEELISSPLREN